ncbi:hypothetical protein [uncultured Maribacter sp.]|uniref:hypothetical protein n=1 Tax=uncultured Maribacter sp. TaxID=431308 RepID=UPI0026383296|nr:hypothetical protein [uncultured Maribacter sp.]
MKKILILSILSLSIIGCAQKTKNKKHMKTRPIVQLYNNPKKLDYSSMPVYHLMDPSQSGCYYEVYVNGVLVSKLYENTTRIGNFVPLNDVILKSGKQKVTIKLFPVENNDGTPSLTLGSDVIFKLEIAMYDAKKENDEGVSVKTYSIPTTTGKSYNTFKYPDAPYYEETFTFEAEVPYTLTGWSESQDLSKMDKGMLEQEVLDFYAEYDKLIQSQDEEKWVEMARNSELEYYKSVAYNNVEDSEIKDRIKEYSNFMDSELIKSYPLDSYEMVFLAEGKVVTLRSLEFPGESAYTFGRMIDNNGKRVETRSSRYLFLHKPKSSNKLEIIRL